ncbi:MBL fold metallo-hydrolase [Georgenia subflava]|uniref:MBL fold metallo-hydrolase n=2 Tax=Georgenia subflava TaxID=1622177 RepID=A0A6N7EPI9_9MICO|nr:MBL fold metallo-hydrolase [Georgenia subflava]
MTLEGTNTWLLREPGAADVVVVDPGPADEQHLRRVLDAATTDGGRVALVVLTHHHSDHAGGAARLAEVTGAPVRGGGRGAEPADGERIDVGGLTIEVVAAPGHTADSVCLIVPADGLLLSGDTVLGRGTTVVSWPDGDLGSYLATLERLVELVEQGRFSQIAPGHGPVVTDPVGALRTLRAHRLHRLEEVRGAVQAGAEGLDAVVEVVYGHLGPDLHRAAALTVQAQLDHLGITMEEPA